MKNRVMQFLSDLVLTEGATDEGADVRRLGYLFVIFFIGFGGFWTACAPLESAALATGIVQVDGKRKVVQHLEGGVISEIKVRNGDLVTEGEALLVLDAARDRAELKILTGRIYETQARFNRLQAERDGLATITFDDRLSVGIEMDSRATEAKANEVSLFVVAKEAREGEEKILEQRVSQLQKQSVGLSSVSNAKRGVAQSLAEEISDLAELLADGFVDRQRLRELKRSETSLVGEIAELDSKIASIQVAIGEAELEILQLRKNFKSDVVNSIASAQAELFDLEQRYSAVRDRVDRATLRAPVSGVVMALEANSSGAVISPSERVMEIVPVEQNLVVDVKISPMDIDRVTLGQEAEIRFSVFKDAYSITGTLEKVSADSIEDPSTGEPYFSGEVALWEEDLTLLGELEIVPGMPAEVLIKTGERTMLGYLTSPLNRMFANSLIED